MKNIEKKGFTLLDLLTLLAILLVLAIVSYRSLVEQFHQDTSKHSKGWDFWIINHF